jgi:nicotinate-nucleotide adenylyltransferase
MIDLGFDPELRTAMFGGTFDPVHNGHLGIARQVLRDGQVAQVLFVPAAVPPHKQQQPVSPGHHRLAMLRLAIDAAGPAGLAVSDCELRRRSVSYTIDTARDLQGRLKHRLRLLLGMDSLVDLHKWRAARQLVCDFEFIVYRRPGIPMPTPLALTAHFGAKLAAKLGTAVIDGPESALSASDVRHRAAAGKAVDGLVPAAVADYIIRHRLYLHSNKENP